MFLSVIIPHFSEDESMIKKLLDSIEFQHNIDLKNDVECIICSDGPNSKPLSDEFLKRYTYPITHLVSEKHLGVSEQRNIGLRNAKGDYVTFNDEVWRIIGVLDTDDGDNNIKKRIKTFSIILSLRAKSNHLLRIYNRYRRGNDILHRFYILLSW